MLKNWLSSKASFSWSSKPWCVIPHAHKNYHCPHSSRRLAVKRFPNRSESTCSSVRRNSSSRTTRLRTSQEACLVPDQIPPPPRLAFATSPLHAIQRHTRRSRRNWTQSLEISEVSVVLLSSASIDCPLAPTFADQNDLPQTMAFVLETFRWRPVSAGGFAHKATKDLIWVSVFPSS